MTTWDLTMWKLNNQKYHIETKLIYIMNLSFKEDHIYQISAFQMLQNLGFKYFTSNKAMRSCKFSNVLRNQLRRINSIRVNSNKEILFSEENIKNSMLTIHKYE